MLHASLKDTRPPDVVELSYTAGKSRAAPAPVQVLRSLGALIASQENAYRIPTVKVRVGNYAFDNTNHVHSGYYSGTRYDAEQLPLENNYEVMRDTLWLATDRA